MFSFTHATIIIFAKLNLVAFFRPFWTIHMVASMVCKVEHVSPVRPYRFVTPLQMLDYYIIACSTTQFLLHRMYYITMCIIYYLNIYIYRYYIIS